MKRAFSYTLVCIIIFILPVSLLIYFLRLYYGLNIVANATDIISIVETMPLFNSLGIWQSELSIVYELLGHASTLMDSFYDSLSFSNPFGDIETSIRIFFDLMAALVYAIKALVVYVWYFLGDILMLVKWVLEVITLYIG